MQPNYLAATESTIAYEENKWMARSETDNSERDTGINKNSEGTLPLNAYLAKAEIRLAKVEWTKIEAYEEEAVYV